MTIQSINTSPGGWIAVDFDGTLVKSLEEYSPTVFGPPIRPMLKRVRDWITDGQEVRIFTARVWPLNICILSSITDDEIMSLHDYHLKVTNDSAYRNRVDSAIQTVMAIRAWSKYNVGQVLTVTNLKDPDMVALFDDKARALPKNR